MRLIDADALKESMGESPLNWNDSPEEIQETFDWNNFTQLIDEAPTISEWVSVNDRLPNDGQDVLAYLYNGEETRIAPFNYDKGTWYDCVMNCTVAINSITHWMPLPEPPIEVSEC